MLRSAQEPITWSFHLPYWPTESTLSGIFLILEAPPVENFAVVFTMHNQKTAVVLCCYTSYASPKHFNNGRKLEKLIIFGDFLIMDVSMFSREIKELPQISKVWKYKRKKNRSGLTQGTVRMEALGNGFQLSINITNKTSHKGKNY